jgi:serine protease inhibitor
MMRRIRLAARFAQVLLGLSVILSGCGVSAQNEQEKAEKAYKEQLSRIYDRNQERIKGAQLLDAGALQSSNELGLRLYMELAREQEGKNIVLSPYSISEAIGMAWQGSAGTTREETAKVMGWNGALPSAIAEQSKALRSYLRLPAEGIKLKASNVLWYRKGLEPLDAYAKTLNDSYEADLTALDFQSPQAVPVMNDWASSRSSIPHSLLILSRRPF